MISQTPTRPLPCSWCQPKPLSEQVHGDQIARGRDVGQGRFLFEMWPNWELCHLLVAHPCVERPDGSVRVAVDVGPEVERGLDVWAAGEDRSLSPRLACEQAVEERVQFLVYNEVC